MELIAQSNATTEAADGEQAAWTLATPLGVFACAVGRSGVTPACDKREGDGATPAGDWLIRRAFYRPDRQPAPKTRLVCDPLRPDDGWCDDPTDAAYNRPVRRPYAARHEVMWRDDGLYDLIVVLSHNDDPPVPGAGSAVFLHCAAPDFAPTEGCVAVQVDVLAALLEQLAPGDVLRVRA